MTDLRKAAEMALEALEAIRGEKDIESAHIIAKNARYSLREALAQGEQEPNWWDDKEYVKNRFGAAAKVVDVRRGLPAGSFKSISEPVKERISEPVENLEPVDLERIYETIIQLDENGGKRSSRELAYLIHALYTAPSISKPLANQEPVFWYRPLKNGFYEGPIHNNSIGGKMYRDEAPNEWKPLYTAPPKREWVGLTDEEFKFIASKYLLNREAGLGYFQEEIEAKLKEKNT